MRHKSFRNPDAVNAVNAILGKMKPKPTYYFEFLGICKSIVADQAAIEETIEQWAKRERRNLGRVERYARKLRLRGAK